MSVNNFMSYADATSIVTKIGQKLAAVNGAYVYRGSVTFANLPSTLTAAMTGYVYNITDDFTTDARFVEGAGKKYSAGTNVAVANLGDATTPNMKFDVVSTFVNVDGLEAEINAVAGSLADVFDTTETYAIGDIVVYEKALYKFKAAHAAGAWDATEVDAVTVESLVQSAEPDSLTPEQIAALLALLD